MTKSYTNKTNENSLRPVNLASGIGAMVETSTHNPLTTSSNPGTSTCGQCYKTFFDIAIGITSVKIVRKYAASGVNYALKSFIILAPGERNWAQSKGAERDYLGVGVAWPDEL